LVTGGAGFVGATTVRELLRAGHRVAVLDDLSAGHRDTLPTEAAFIHACTGDRARVAAALREHQVEALLHFAARIEAGESVREPRLYWRQNVATTIELLDVALEAGLRTVVFSSSAAVYGNPVRLPIEEAHPTVPVSPYGETKLTIETILRNYGEAYGLRWVALRYFNAAGADTEAGLGERHEPETHLIPLTIRAALGSAPLTVFGRDFETPDGTAVRDYVHVRDLAAAHVAALTTPVSGPVNLGTGRGTSVIEVLEAVRRLSGREVPHSFGARRRGDPPILVACAAKAASTLGWRATRGFDQIVQDALTFHASTVGR
jgi:UDP-glucose-4-epimerase GalE